MRWGQVPTGRITKSDQEHVIKTLSLGKAAWSGMQEHLVHASPHLYSLGKIYPLSASRWPGGKVSSCKDLVRLTCSLISTTLSCSLTKLSTWGSDATDIASGRKLKLCRSAKQHFYTHYINKISLLLEFQWKTMYTCQHKVWGAWLPSHNSASFDARVIHPWCTVYKFAKGHHMGSWPNNSSRKC